MTIKGSLVFVGGIDDANYQKAQKKGRLCTSCGDPVQDRTKGNLCRACRNRAKANKRIQYLKRRVVEKARERT